MAMVWWPLTCRSHFALWHIPVSQHLASFWHKARLAPPPKLKKKVVIPLLTLVRNLLVERLDFPTLQLFMLLLHVDNLKPYFTWFNPLKHPPPPPPTPPFVASPSWKNAFLSRSCAGSVNTNLKWAVSEQMFPEVTPIPYKQPFSPVVLLFVVTGRRWPSTVKLHFCFFSSPTIKCLFLVLHPRAFFFFFFWLLTGKQFPAELFLSRWNWYSYHIGQSLSNISVHADHTQTWTQWVCVEP